MKIRKKDSAPKAARIFTDREEPRKAFWDKYEEIKKDFPHNENIYILTYYGIGGIGKSSLLDKLMSEMEEKLDSPVYADINFNNFQDSRTALENLKNKLSEKYKFSFPLFELGLYVYAIKLGETPDSNEIKSLTKKSPTLSLIKKIVSTIPYINIASAIFDIADEGIAYLRNYFKDHSKALSGIESKTAEELKAYLPELFSEDLSANLENSKEPLVIFIDTYEKLVNEISRIGEPLLNDLWLRGENGPIQNIPGVLWVIAGRERIKWDKFDKDWEDSLEQHLLGNLSYEDSDSFLSFAGIEDENLRKEISKLTNGTPVYLDLCVDRYHRIIESGEAPEISMFGNDIIGLVERFARYMELSQQDMVYMLSCLEDWDDEVISEIAPSVLSNFSDTAYEKIKGYSFINFKDEKYSIHQTVGEILFKTCPDTIRKKSGKALIEKYLPHLAEKENAVALYQSVKGGLLLYEEPEFLSFYNEHIRHILLTLSKTYGAEAADNTLDIILERFKEESVLLATILSDKSATLLNLHKLGAGENCAIKSVELFIKLLGENHPETLSAMENLGINLSASRKYEEALEIHRKVYEKRVEILGENHPHTLSALNNLSISLSNTEFHDEAVRTAIKLYEKRLELLGEEHPDTLFSMNNLALRYMDEKNYEEALPLLEKCYEKRFAIYGENHIKTLDVLNNISVLCLHTGEPEKALAMQEEVYKLRLEALGETHHLTVASLHMLSICHAALKEYEKSAEICQKTYEACLNVYGEANPYTLNILAFLTDRYYAAGNISSAADACKRLYETTLSLYGKAHPETLRTMINLVSLYAGLKDYKKAVELQKSIYETFLETRGKDDSDTIEALRILNHLEKL